MPSHNEAQYLCGTREKSSRSSIMVSVTGGKIMRMRERVWSMLGGLVLIALGVGLAWYEGPLLLRDFGISSNVEAATQARLVKGRCKSRLIILFCDLTIDQNLAGVTHQTELNYLFIDIP